MYYMPDDPNYPGDIERKNRKRNHKRAMALALATSILSSIGVAGCFLAASYAYHQDSTIGFMTAVGGILLGVVSCAGARGNYARLNDELYILELKEASEVEELIIKSAEKFK